MGHFLRDSWGTWLDLWGQQSKCSLGFLISYVFASSSESQQGALSSGSPISLSTVSWRNVCKCVNTLSPHTTPPLPHPLAAKRVARARADTTLFCNNTTFFSSSEFCTTLLPSKCDQHMLFIWNRVHRHHSYCTQSKENARISPQCMILPCTAGPHCAPQSTPPPPLLPGRKSSVLFVPPRFAASPCVETGGFFIQIFTCITAPTPKPTTQLTTE